MESIYHYPQEILDLLQSTPLEFIKKLHIDPLLVNNLNTKQLYEKFAEHIAKILDQFPKFTTDRNVMLLYHFTLFISQHNLKLKESISKFSYIEELVWDLLLHLTNETREDDYNIPDHTIVPSNQLENLIISLLNLLEEKNQYDKKISRNIKELYLKSRPEILKNKILTGLCFGFIANNLTVDEVVPILEELLILYKKFNMSIIQMYLDNQLGILNLWRYNINQSEKYFEKSITMAQNIGNEKLERNIKGNMAILYSEQGQLEKTRDIYLEQIDNGYNLKQAYYNLATIYLRLEEYEQSIQYSKIFHSKFDTHQVFRYLALHHALLLDSQIDEARSVLEEAEILLQENPTASNKAYILWLRARQQYYESNFGASFKLYDQFIEKDYEFGYLKELFTVSLEKIQLQLEIIDLRSKIKDNAKEDLLYDITSVIQLADEQQIPPASAEALFLRGKIHHSFGNLDQAESDTYNAQKLANKFDIDHLEEEINQFRNNQLVNGDEQKESIWTSIKTGIKRFVSTTFPGELEKPDYIMHGVIILANTGLPLYDTYFSSRLESEPALVSGLITAVSSFMGELGKGSGYLKSIQHDDLSLILERVQNFVIVSIVSKETFEARLKTKRYSNRIDTILSEKGIREHPGEVTHELVRSLEICTQNYFDKFVNQT